LQETSFITLIPSLAFVSVSPSSSFTEDLCAKHSINVYFMTIGDNRSSEFDCFWLLLVSKP
ncbi:unnamed protein product, partial [Musa acuminata subsp. burmannicoides]